MLTIDPNPYIDFYELTVLGVIVNVAETSVP